MPMPTSTLLNRAIDLIGSPITIRIGSITFDAYGTGSLSFAGSVATGYVQILNETDSSVMAGILDVGDAIGYFKIDAGFPLGSKIEVLHQGTTFETLGEQTIPHLSGNQLMRQINLRRKAE